jgi:hypothetical protein
MRRCSSTITAFLILICFYWLGRSSQASGWTQQIISGRTMAEQT